MKQHMPALLAASAPLRALAADLHAADRAAQAKAASRMIDLSLRLWGSGQAGAPGVETFAGFRARVARAMARLTAIEGRGKTVIAFTSGGFIGAAAAHALRADDEAALDLGTTPHNASLTELLFDGARATLSTFNTKPHLPDPALWTYR
jgi:broad specificity phosphatase PhoE